GKYIVFSSAADFGFDTPANVFQIYRVEIDAIDVSQIEIISIDTNGDPASSHCEHPSISDDGLVIAFDTEAELDATLDQNDARDVYVRDLRGVNPITRLISVSDSTGDAADSASRYPSVSGDGTIVVFSSTASDLLST